MITEQEIRQRIADATAWHERQLGDLQTFAAAFEAHLREAARAQGERLAKARLELRLKSAESYANKAAKVSAGGFKYEKPAEEITDLVAARVTVPMSLDLPAVMDFIRDTFIVEEESARGSEEDNLFTPGYRSTHFLVLPRKGSGLQRQIVEIQVRTILQHAWAELQHDLLYKSDVPPDPLVHRRLTALAGLLELAEKEFGEVRLAHAGVSSVSGTLSAATLRSLATELFGEDDQALPVWYDALAGVMESLGLTTVEELVGNLGDWITVSKPIATLLRTTRPGTNQAIMLDLLVRLALRDRYFDRRPPSTWGRVAKPAVVAELRAGFLAELDTVSEQVRA